MLKRRAEFMQLLQQLSRTQLTVDRQPMHDPSEAFSQTLPRFETIVHTLSYIHTQHALLDQLIGTVRLLASA